MSEGPVLRVVRGEPTAEELAAVTALMAAAGADPAAAPEPPQRGRWNDPTWQHRRALPSGPGAWRAAARW